MELTGKDHMQARCRTAGSRPKGRSVNWNPPAKDHHEQAMACHTTML